MDRLISEQAVLNELDKELYSHNAKMAIKAIPAADPSGDLISRQDAIKAIEERAKRIKNEDTLNGLAGAVGILFELPSVNPQEKTGHWKDFALWVANEIFVYEWEYNKDAFAEIACRKLAKLGIVREKDGEWELVEPQEKSEE